MHGRHVNDSISRVNLLICVLFANFLFNDVFSFILNSISYLILMFVPFITDPIIEAKLHHHHFEKVIIDNFLNNDFNNGNDSITTWDKLGDDFINCEVNDFAFMVFDLVDYVTFVDINLSADFVNNLVNIRVDLVSNVV